MSGASTDRDQVRTPRPLRLEERDLVLALLRHLPSFEALSQLLGRALIVDMNDGGMGSIKFLPPGRRDRRFGMEVAKAHYTDEDGVLVSIALNLDNHGELFEMDFWKTDFSPLIRYPRVDQLEFVARMSH
jgi:hypothetical protein